MATTPVGHGARNRDPSRGTPAVIRVFLLLAIVLLAGIPQRESAGFDLFASGKQFAYFDGLRERGLFELTELLCQQRLAKPNLSADVQQFYLVELARTFALHAQHVSTEESAELWGQALQTLNGLPRDSPVKLTEQALILAARAEQSFQIARAAVGEPAWETVAVEQVQAGLAALTGAAEKINAVLNGREGDPSGRLTEQRRDEIAVATARLHLRLVELLPASRTERMTHRQAASKILAPLSRRSAKSTYELEADLLLLTLARLEDSESQVSDAFTKLNRPAVPPAVRARAAVELARFQLSRNDPTAAATTILEHARETGLLTDEMESVRLQALLLMAVRVRAEKNIRLAQELEQEVAERLQRLERKGASFFVWAVRNYQQQLTVQSEYGPEAAQALARVRTALASQDHAQITAAYAAAVQQLLDTRQTAAAQQLVRQSAAWEFQHGHPKQAAQQLERVWRAAPQFEQMEDIHLLWIQALGRVYMAGRTNDKLTAYMAALEDHQRRYPGAATQSEVLWLLAELQFARLQVTKALELYRQIPAASQRGEAARLRELQCYRWIVRRVEELGQPAQAWQLRTVTFAQDILAEARTWDVLSVEAAELIVLAGRVLLEANEFQDETWQTQINRVLQVRPTDDSNSGLSPSQTARWEQIRQQAKALRGIALAGAGQISAARQFLIKDRDPAAPPQETLFLVSQLVDLEFPSPETRIALAELCLELTDPLFASPGNPQPQLTAEQRQLLLTCRAKALLNLDRLSAAIELYEQLAAARPNDRALLLRLSALYDECANTSCRERNYQLWQIQLAREKQGSDAWLDARYQLARLAGELNRRDEALKIVQVTLLLYPAAGDADRKAKWEELARQLQATGK